MAGERRTATFQQLHDEGLLEIGDGYRAQNNELGGTSPIFLRAGHVTDSHIDFTGVEHFRDHLAVKVRSKMSKVGDTIITTKGNSTGRTSFVTDRLPPFVYSPHLSYWRSRDPEKLCGGFLRYWSQGVEFIDQLSGMKASMDMAPYLSLSPITLAQMRSFTAPMKSRNPVLHYVFARMGMAEEQGYGLISLKKHAEKLRLPLPSFSMEGDSLVLTIFRNKAGVVARLRPEVRASLNDDEKASGAFFSGRQSVSSPELMEQMGFDERKAQRVLKKLQEAGLLRRVGRGPATRYDVIQS